MTDIVHNSPPFFEIAYDGWLSDYYDAWYPPDDACAQLVQRLIAGFPDLRGKDRAALNLWDCACGTGNTYIPLSRAGYRPWGSDGSSGMLEHARRKCAAEGIPTARLIEQPLAWNDSNSIRRHLFDAGPFDIVFALNNSLCHMPAAPNHLDAALSNFFALLKPGGHLIVDTKRYISKEFDGVLVDWEMRFENNEWRPRGDRRDGPRTLGSGDDAYFHTSLQHDVDPVLRVPRAMLVVTVEMTTRPREAHVVPYYPLPAAALISQLQQAGFVTSLQDARKPPLEWSYDCVVAERPAG